MCGDIVKFTLVEDFNGGLEEQTNRQANINAKTKTDLKKIANDKGLTIKLPKGSVVHHRNDSKGLNGLKNNDWSNVLVIPSLEGNSSYGEMVHKIITVFSKMPVGTSIENFFKDILELKVYSYDEQLNNIDETKVKELMVIK